MFAVLLLILMVSLIIFSLGLGPALQATIQVIIFEAIKEYLMPNDCIDSHINNPVTWVN
ncbi:hypothetical protein KT99_13977 [Shewanella benthica KT99]|uniref:Uncharacterized protein n=1 Tax=Shewanella benthica KT99 TaxID=314608 RepID=A9DES6_9GAMM|nr:hypothetical protein KT99_13977 [Shewanella benthica KT99]